MAIAMQGLRLKPRYEDLIGVAVSDGLQNIRFPNRDAKQLRDGFILSQLDGEGMRQMEKQQEMASKEAYKEHLLKEIAKNTGANIHGLRNDAHQEMRTERVERALHFDISQDDDDVAMTASTGVQANTQTSSSSAQTNTQTSSSSAQTVLPRRTFEAGTQSEKRVNTKGTQATEDKSEEIEKLKRASELEKQALIDYHNQNIERIRQQVMAEGEAAHGRKKEEYQREVLEELQMNEAEAQRRINQAQQQAQQEAQTHFTDYAGRITEYAEHQYRQEQQTKRTS